VRTGDLDVCDHAEATAHDQPCTAEARLPLAAGEIYINSSVGASTNVRFYKGFASERTTTATNRP
jgi:hypothetical protein